MFYGCIKYQIRNKILILVIAVLLGLLWQEVGAPHLTGQSTSTSVSVLSLPSAFLKTMFYRWIDTDFIYTGDIVKNFYFSAAGAKVGMPALAITLMNILFAVYLFVGYPEKAKNRLPKKESVALTLASTVVATGVILGSFAALYIASSDLQDGTGIRGVQPRYFYTAFLLLAVLPYIRYFKVDKVKYFALVTVVGSIVLLGAKALALAVEFHWGFF